MSVLLRILGFLKPHKGVLALAYLSLLGATGFYLALPKLLGESVDRVLEEGQLSFLIWAGLGIIAISIMRGIFAFAETFLREKLAQLVAYDIRNALYDHIQRLSFSFHDKQQTGQLMSRATADIEGIRWFISLGVIRLSYMLLLIAGVAVMLLTINLPLAAMSLAFIPILIIRGSLISRQLRVIWTRAQERMGELGTLLQESMTGIKVVKVFAREEHENEKFGRKAAELARENFSAMRVQASHNPLMTFVFTGIMVVILWFGGRQVIEGRLSAGELTQFFVYLAILQMPVRMMGFMINLQARAISSGERIFEILDTLSSVQEKPGAVDMGRSQGRVAMEGVSFEYSIQSPVLHDVSFEAQPGQTVALLGATGSGKSTVVHLVPRFYDVSTGRVLIDGTDIRDVTLESLRQNIGIVQQDVFLFSATIRNNIAYGVPGVSEDKIISAAKVARIHDFIMTLPQGYETWVGERGMTLSGGQKQRISIARTLLMDPPILILDDSTSSVDTRTEFEILQALQALVQGRTTFVIAQRLSTLRSADQILVLDEGRIVQRGTHDELLTQGGIYREIYELQLRPQEEASAQAAATQEARS